MQTEPIRAGGAIPRPLFLAATRRPAVLKIGAAIILLTAAASPVDAGPLTVVRAKIGAASWYGFEFAKRKTAAGNRFDPHGFTGAHRTFPLGSKVLVTNLHNGRSVLVTITDRGPFRRRREIDLSYGAARAIGIVERGVAPVRIQLLDS